MLKMEFNIYDDSLKVMQERLERVRKAKRDIAKIDNQVFDEIKEWIKKDNYDEQTLSEYELFILDMLKKIEFQFGWMSTIKKN